MEAPQLEMSTEGSGKIVMYCAALGFAVSCVSYYIVKGVALQTVNNANKALEEHIVDKTIDFFETAFDTNLGE